MLHRNLKSPRRLLLALIGGLCLLVIDAEDSWAAELLISDRANGRVVAFDAETGAFTRVVLDQVLTEPAAITMGPGGFGYVSHIGFDPGAGNVFGEIIKFDPVTGDFESFASGLNFPGGLAYEPNSNTLFFSEFGNFDGELIHQFDADGDQIGTIGAGTGGTGKTGMAFDENGDLYVSAFATDGFFTGAVLKFDASDDFAPLGVFATQVSGPGQSVPFNGANGLAFDASGELFAAGLLNHGVVKFPSSGGTDVGTQFGELVPSASAVLFDEAGDLLVSGLGNDNPDDPTFGSNLFPGGVLKFDGETGDPVGDGPFIGTQILSLDQELNGDFDGNELVDGDDLSVLESAFGTSDAADTDGDGDTDGADFLNYQSVFGALGAFQPTSMTMYEPGLIGGAGVPEPASIALAIFACAAMSAARRRIG